MWAKSKSSIANANTTLSKTTSITNGSMTTNTELIIINAVESSWPGGYLIRHVDVWNMIGELIIIVHLIRCMNSHLLARWNLFKISGNLGYFDQFLVHSTITTLHRICVAILWMDLLGHLKKYTQVDVLYANNRSMGLDNQITFSSTEIYWAEHTRKTSYIRSISSSCGLCSCLTNARARGNIIIHTPPSSCTSPRDCGSFLENNSIWICNHRV